MAHGDADAGNSGVQTVAVVLGVMQWTEQAEVTALRGSSVAIWVEHFDAGG